jgi:hypothetical protein
MAKHTLAIAETLRKTADLIRLSSNYQWGHMGSCNCGFLAQKITGISRNIIHQSAMERHGDWNEQLHDYCPTSGLRMDDIISRMLDLGFDTSDLKHLEKLSDPSILSRLSQPVRYLAKNKKEDVIKYLIAWAEMIEEALLPDTDLNEMFPREVTEKFTMADA